MEKMKKLIVYVDMDGVLCNFYSAAKSALIENPDQKYPQSKWGFFLKLKEIPGAIEGFNKLKEKYDVWILTRPSFQNVNCYTEKAQWIWDHLGYDVLKKTIMSPDKSLLKGDYLIDDQLNAGQAEFEGVLLRFGTDFPDWDSITDFLL
jgi:5'-nucleotidase